MEDKALERIRMSDVAMLEKAQERLLIYVSMYVRCGLPKPIAKEVIEKAKSDYEDLAWEVPYEEQRRSRYHYAFCDYDGKPSEQYMKIDYEDLMMIDGLALSSVDRLTVDKIKLIPTRRRRAEVMKWIERRRKRGIT